MSSPALSLDRGLPASTETERTVIGSILVNTPEGKGMKLLLGNVIPLFSAPSMPFHGDNAGSNPAGDAKSPNKVTE